jgi:recombination protein RecA
MAQSKLEVFASSAWASSASASAWAWASSASAPAPAPARAPAWALPELAGRLVELSGPGAAATLTLALRLVLDAQGRDEPAAWLTDRGSCFFPPDAADGGVDLDALVVVRVAEPAAVARAADQLARSGAFGLLMLDLGRARVPDPLQSRLLGLAQKHETAIVFLTEKPSTAPSLGSLVSLRCEAGAVRPEPGSASGFGCESPFECALRALKDKRRAPGWSYQEACRGPAGLR